MLSPTHWKRWSAGLLCAVALFVLYFFGLTRTGLLGPDEPRYAAIGRAMAETGDWVTPNLWGKPWFEKPPLLYWMTALGFKAGLDPDLAPRLPVAIVSVAFLLYFFIALRREFGEGAAFYGGAVLATSVGWLAYSRVAVTDLPLSAAFAAAMLIVMRGLDNARASLSAGVLLGLAILAKGLVPLALFLPALWFLRRRIPRLLAIFAVAIAIAAPWYVLVTWRNGTAFLDVFFVKQHFGRLASAALGHQQPFWFYLPVLLAGLFPWTPFLMLLFRRETCQDRRAAFLLSWLLWGLVFFSLFLNKLPGYLLPLLPAAAALLGIAIAGAKDRSILLLWSISLSAAMLCFMPSVQDLLPVALANGLSRVHFHIAAFWILPALGAGVICSAFARIGHRTIAISLITSGMTVFVAALAWLTYPVIDRVDSARDIWNAHAKSITCVSETERSRRFGLNYYASRDLPDCN